MLGGKLQKFGLNGRGHDESAVLDALSPAQQVGRLQGVEHVAPLLLLIGRIAASVTSLKTVQFLVVIVDDLVPAFASQNLLAGADGTDAAGLVGTALGRCGTGRGIFVGFIVVFCCDIIDN